MNRINVFTHVRNWWSRRSLTLADKEILDFLKINKSGVHSDKLKELTYFTCIKILSESMSKIPCNYIKMIMAARKRLRITGSISYLH